MKADPKTEAAVMAVMNQFIESFQKQDLDGNLPLYAPDDDVVAIGTGADEKCVGLAEIKTASERTFTQSETQSIQLSWHSVSAAGAVAWVASDGIMQAKVSGQEMSFPIRLTFVLERRGERWLIVHLHWSLPAAGQKEGDSWPAESS